MYSRNELSQSHRYIPAPQYPQNHLPFMGNWYYSAQQVVPANHDPEAAILTKRHENKEFIENFLNKSKEYCCKDEKLGNRKKTLRISEAREIAINVCRMQKTLEMMSEKMRKSENMAVSEWDERWQKCRELRNEITKLMDRFEQVEGIVDSLKKRVDQRGRKRRREARKKGQLKAEKVIALERRVGRHAEADAWIREKQVIIEREKQVQLLRKDADIVLADVRGKRSDAKKFLGLLQELQNLRRVKVNIARARGENLPFAADQAFDNIIGQLLDQWTCLDREYSIEEQGLKLMLKTDNEEKIQKQKRSTFDDWESVLFGRKLESCDSTRADVHTFVIIRHAWDKYVNYNDDEGSRIPIGWVMPVIPSSAAWQKSLRRE